MIYRRDAIYINIEIGYCDRSNWVRFVTKTKHNSDLANRIGPVYGETKLNYWDLTN